MLPCLDEEIALYLGLGWFEFLGASGVYCTEENSLVTACEPHCGANGLASVYPTSVVEAKFLKANLCSQCRSKICHRTPQLISV